MSTRSEFETFLGAIRFFTRLPVPGTLGHDAAVLERAVRYFPLIGLLVGAVAGFAFAVTSYVWPKTLAVLAAMATAILLTGALHEDGWSDAIDGLGGGRDRDRILEIMRDSRVGNYGAVALVMILLARFFALIEIDMLLIPIALIAGQAASRLCMAFVMYSLDYARADGKARPFSNRLTSSDKIFAGLSGLLPAALLPLGQAIFGLLFAAGATLWLTRLFRRRIGGYTGDCLGAVQQLSEAAFYCGLLCRFS